MQKYILLSDLMLRFKGSFFIRNLYDQVLIKELTSTQSVKCPSIVLKKGMLLDLVHASASEPFFAETNVKKLFKHRNQAEKNMSKQAAGRRLTRHVIFKCFREASGYVNCAEALNVET